MESKRLYKANALIEASYRMSAYEQRILAVCISQVRRDAPLTDQYLYTVSAQYIADQTNTSLGTAYQNLKAAAGRLYRREVTLHEAPNGGGEPAVRLTRWVQTVEYRKNEGIVALRFATDMIPYLSQLTEQFTQLSTSDLIRMTSNHGQRLYELLCQWRGSGQREISIEWLREALQIGEKYPAIKDLKKWVIVPAVEQVNEHSSLWVKWDQRKTGRRVSHLIFTFGEKAKTKPKKSRKIESRSSPSSNSKGSIYGISMAAISAHAKPGESERDAALRILDERKRKA